MSSGWSWSSKFGDLDNDGFLDIYAVNGMIADGLFSHLPGDELVEENRALRNNGNGYFVLASEWGLGSTASGRGMSMADLDDDGKPDGAVIDPQFGTTDVLIVLPVSSINARYFAHFGAPNARQAA